MYAKITIDKDVNNRVEGYEKYTGGDLKVHETPVAPDKTLSKIDVEEPDDIIKYISFVGK